MDCTVVEAVTPVSTSPVHTTITVQEAPNEVPPFACGEEFASASEAGEDDTDVVDGDTDGDSDSSDDEDSFKDTLEKYKEAKKYFVRKNGIIYVPNAQWDDYQHCCVGCHLYVASDVPYAAGGAPKSATGSVSDEQPHERSMQIGHDEEPTETVFLPHRVRITNSLLLHAMAKAVGSYDMNKDHVAPFRCLVSYHDEFRKLLQQQEQKFSKLATTYPDDPAVRRTHSWLPVGMAFGLPNSLGSIQPPDGDMTKGIEPKGRDDVLRARVLLDGLKALIHFLDCDLGTLTRARQQIAQGSLERIPFHYLWYLYHPGQVIITKRPKYQAYRVLQVCGGRRLLRRKNAGAAPVTKPTNLVIDCFYLDFDGKEIRALPKTISIRPYDGQLPVTVLDAYPLEYASEGLARDLIRRGEKFIDLIKVSHKRYKGLNINESDFDKYEEIDSDVIIDFELALRTKEVGTSLPEYGGGVILEPTEEDPKETRDGNTSYDHKPMLDKLRSDFIHNTSLLEDQGTETQLSDERLILLPPRVYGYVLLSRAWYPLDIDLISDIRIISGDQPDPFDDIVLPDKHRDIVRALVKTHARARGTLGSTETAHTRVKHEFDIVKGKGRGLIILLHGAPGVGKTSTAECVAAHTGRPLFPITCGDLGGDSAQEVEANLERFFDMARKWGCVLLLDEADVFLSERIKGDIRQNSLVSVFLRVLEYYSGILILTTNRVGDFDEAATSRIHCALYYPPFNRERTLEVWRKGINRLKLQNEHSPVPVKCDRKEIMNFARRLWKDGCRWNGRQIKNALQTAVALAEWDRIKENPDSEACPQLKVEHLQAVADANAHFESYLTQVRSSDRTRASHNAIRRDDLTEKLPDASSRRKQTTSKSRKKGMQKAWPIFDSDDDESEEETGTDDSETTSQGDSESGSESGAKVQLSKKITSHQKKKGKDGEKNKLKGSEKPKKEGKSKTKSSSKKFKKEPPPSESSSSSETGSGSEA
ncbi:hypothetical protein AbraIFM66951_009615 [Aspergillus brasiliensis]|uniref:AAA+ ATPase domain-containing protein n=1 Tax=Aspergillus brasiliensis TaxID=319629 RepID=A0A9W5YJ87_9EURO|nr:hypothetical protein AbraCBS73388_010026 [Aspergillus brasiliensis]GKZ46490.1 hypothetical protein AbraIFM66951_009615 [Aspergillus brasiliensis]